MYNNSYIPPLLTTDITQPFDKLDLENKPHTREQARLQKYQISPDITKATINKILECCCFFLWILLIPTIVPSPPRLWTTLSERHDGGGVGQVNEVKYGGRHSLLCHCSNYKQRYHPEHSVYVYGDIFRLVLHIWLCGMQTMRRNPILSGNQREK